MEGSTEEGLPGVPSVGIRNGLSVGITASLASLTRRWSCLSAVREKPARCVLRGLSGGDPDLIDFAGSTKLHCSSSCSS
jgi:hypothetical protein